MSCPLRSQSLRLGPLPNKTVGVDSPLKSLESLTELGLINVEVRSKLKELKKVLTEVQPRCPLDCETLATPTFAFNIGIAKFKTFI